MDEKFNTSGYRDPLEHVAPVPNETVKHDLNQALPETKEPTSSVEVPLPAVSGWSTPETVASPPVIPTIPATPVQQPANASGAGLPAYQPQSDSPTPVVKVLSVRGVEYFFMSFALWIGAASLVWAILALINNYHSVSTMAFPIASLIVCLPVFAYLFLRLRKQELENPSLRYEPSKRRLTQITQILAFLSCFFNLISFVYIIIVKIGGDKGPSIGKAFINLIVILAVAGGILAYYWADEHRMNRG